MASEADPPESTPIPREDVDDDERPSRWSHGPVEEFHIKDSTTGFIPHHIKFSGSAEAKQLKTHLPAGQESNIFKGNEGTSDGECFSKAPIIKKVAYEDTDRLSEDCLDTALSNQAETGTTDNRNQQHRYNFEAAKEMKEEAIEQLKHETREKSSIDVEVSNEVEITPDQHVSGGITEQDTEEAASSMQKNEVESTETDKDDDGGPQKEVLDSLEDQRKDAPVSAPADVIKSSTKDVGSALNASNQKEHNTVGTHLTALKVQYGGTTFNGKSEASFTSAAEEGPEAKPIEGDKLVSEKDKGEGISYHGQRDVSISTMSTSHTLNGEEIIIETDVIGNKRNTSSTPTEVAADKTSSEKIKEVVKEEQPPCPSFAEEYQDKFQTGGKVTDEIPNVEENNLKNAAAAQAEGHEAERFNKDNLQNLLSKMEPETIVKVKTSAEDKEGEILKESGGIHHNLEETAVKDDNQGPNPWISLSREEEGLQEDNNVSLNQASAEKENVGIRSMECNIIQEEHIGTQEHIEKPTKEHEALNSLCQTDETHEPEDIDVAATRECTEQAAVAGEAPVTELVEEGSKETRKAGEPIGTDYTNKHGTLGPNVFVEVNLSEITRSTETDITNKITNGVSIAATSINQTTEAEGERQDEVPKFELQELEANKVSTEEVKGASEVNKNTRFESIERKPYEEPAVMVLSSTTSHIEHDQTNIYCLEPQKTEEAMSTEDIVDTGIKAKDMSPVGLQEVLVASDTEKGIGEDAPTTASILECTANETIEQSFEAVSPNGTEQDICGQDKNHCIEDNKSKDRFTNQEEDGSHIIEEKHTDDQAMEYLIQEQIAGNVTESSQEDNKTKGEKFWMTINKAQDAKYGHATDLAPECIEGTIAKLSSYNEATESIKEELHKPELVNKEKSPDESQDYSHDDSIDSSILQYDASIKGDYTNLDPQELQIDQNTAEEATSRPVAEEASLIKSSQDDEITEKSFQKGALEDRPAENLNTDNEMDGAAVSTKDVQQIGQAQKEENIQTYRETTEEPKEEEKLVQNDDCNENKISKEDIANEASSGRECIDWESSPTTDKFELKRKGRVSELKIEEKPDSTNSRTPIKSKDAKTKEQIPWVDACGDVEGTATDDTLTRGTSLHDGEAVDLSCEDNKKEQQCNEKAVSELSELKNEKVVLNASVENYTKSFTKDPNPSSQLARYEKINSPQKIEVETAEPQVQMLEEYGTTTIQNFEQTTNEEVAADDSLQIAAEIEGPDQGLDAVHSVEASQSEESESKKYQDKDIMQGDHAEEETGDKVDDETADEAPDTRQKDEYKIKDGTNGTPSNNMPEETNNKLPMLPVKDKDTSTTDVSNMAEGTIHIRNAHEEITLQEDAKIQNLDHGGLQEVSVGNENNAVSEEVHKDRNLHNTLETHAQRNISESRDMQIQKEEMHEVRESNDTNKPDELKDNTGNREYEKENVDRTSMGIEASGPQSYAENENSYNIEEAVETKEVTIIEVEHHHHADEAPNTITDLRAEGSYESNNPLQEPECSSKPAAEVDTPSETNKAENEERSRSMLDHCAKSAEEPTTEERQREVRSLTTEATETNLEPDCPTDNAQETHQVPKETEFDNGAKMVPEESTDEENDVEKSHLGTGDKTDHKENPCKEQEASITAKTSEVSGTPEGEIQKAEDFPGPVCESPEEITKEQITEEPDHYNHTLDNTSKTEEIALTGQEIDSRNFEGTLHTISKLPITECDSPGQEGVTVEDLPSHAVAAMEKVPGAACEPTDEAHRKISEDSSTKKLDSDDMTAQKVSNGTVPHTTISLNKGDQQSQHLSSELFAESNAPTAIKDTEGENRMEVQILIPKNIEDHSSGRTIKETCMQEEVPREIGISNLGPETEEVHKTHETSIMKGESSLGLPCTTTMEGEKSTEPERTGDGCSKGTQDDEKTVGSDSDNSGKNNDITSQSHSTGKQICQDNTKKASEDTSNTSCQKADSTEHIPELHKIITESQETESKEENLEVTSKILSSIDNIPKDVCKELPMKPKDEHGSFTTEASKMKDATLLTSNVPEKIQQENEEDSENSDSLQQLRSTDNGKEIFLGEINQNKYKDQHMTPQLNTRSISGSEDAEILKGEETNEESKPTETNIEGTMKDEDTVKEGFQDNFENEKSSKEASIGVEKSGPYKVTNRQQDAKIPDDSIQESVEVKEVAAAENDASNSTNNWLSAEKNSESANPLEKLQYRIKAAVTSETLSETKADSEGESNNMEQHYAKSAEQQVSEETCRKDTDERILTTHEQKTSREDEYPMNKEQDATQAYKEHELKEETESIQEEITANESSPKKLPQVIVQDRTQEVTPVEDSDSQSKLSYEVTNSEKPEAMTSEVKGSSNIESEASAAASTSEECVLPTEESQKSKEETESIQEEITENESSPKKLPQVIVQDRTQEVTPVEDSDSQSKLSYEVTNSEKPEAMTSEVKGSSNIESEASAAASTSEECVLPTEESQKSKEETESIQEEITENESSPKKLPQVIVQDRTQEVTPVEDSDSQSKLSYEVTNSEKPEAMTSEVKGSSNIESEASAAASTSEECVLPTEESQKSKEETESIQEEITENESSPKKLPQVIVQDRTQEVTPVEDSDSQSKLSYEVTNSEKPEAMTSEVKGSSNIESEASAAASTSEECVLPTEESQKSKEETESIQEEITENESSPKKLPQVIVQDRTQEVTPVEDSDSQSKLSYEVTNSEKPEAMTSEVKGSSNIESEASAAASTSEECVLPTEESQKSKDVICPLCEPPEESTEVEITEVAGNHDNKFNNAAAAMVTEVEKVQEAQLQEISQKGHDFSCNEKDQHVTDKMETASIKEEKREPSEEISNSTSDQPAIDNEIVSESTTVVNPPEYNVAVIETMGMAVEAGDEVPQETNVNKTTEKLGSYDTVEETKLANEPESDNIYQDADANTREEIATSQSPWLNKAEEESQQQFSGKNDASEHIPELLNEDTEEAEVTNMKREHLEEASTRTTAEDYPSQRPFLHHNVIESAEEEEGIEDTNQHSIDEGTISKSHQEADKYTREEANEASCTRMVAILSEEVLQDSKIKDSTESIQEPIKEQKNNFGELHQAIISTETDPENHDTSDSDKPVKTMNLEVIGNSNKDPEESTVARTMEECGTVEDERECSTVEDETKRPEDIIRKVHADPEENMKGDNMEASHNCNNEVDNKSLTTATEKEILQVTQRQVNSSNMLNVSSNETEQQKSDRIEIAPNVEEFDSTNHEEIPVTVSIDASAECKSAGKEHRAADQPPEKERIHGAVVPKPEDEIPRETDQNPTTEQLSSDDTIEGKTICHSSYQDVESIMEDNIAVRQALPSNTTKEQPQHPSSESVPDAKETNAATIKKFTEEVNSNTAQIIKEEVRDDSFPKKIIEETSLPQEAPRDIEVFNLGSESSKNLHPREVLAEEVNCIDTVPILEHGESSLQMSCMNYPSGSEEISEANRIVGNFLQETKYEKEDQASDNSGQKTDMSPQIQLIGEQTPQDNLERKCKEASDINHQAAEASEKIRELHDEGSTESEGTNMKEAHLKEVREKPTTEQCKCQETFESCILKERGSSAKEVEGEESLEDFEHQTIDEENKRQSHQEAEKGTGELAKPTASTGMNENLHEEVPKDSDITEEVTDAKKINQPTNQDRTVPEVKSSVDSNSGSIQKHEAADLDRQTGCSEVTASIHNEPGAPTAARTLEISRTLEEESEMPDDVRSTMYEVLEESIKEESIEASEKDNAKIDNTSLRTATEEKSLQETRPQERMSDSFDASSNKKDELTMDEIEIAPKEEEVTSTNHEQTSNSIFNNPFPECKIAGKESAVFENQTPNEAPENLTAETCLKEVSGEVEDSNLNVKPSEDSQSKEALMEELQSTDEPSTLDTEGILAKLSCTNSFSEREKNIHSDLQDENRDSREVKGSNNSEHEIDCYPQSHLVGEEISDDNYKKTCISRHITVLSDELVAESEQTNFNKSHLEIGNSSERPQVTANENSCDEVERGDEFLSESNQQSQDEETKKDSHQEDNQIVEHAKNEGNQVFSTRIKDAINDQVPDINEKNGSMLEEITEEESHVKKLHQATTGDRTKEKMEPVQDCNSVSVQNEDINIIVKKTEGSEVKKSSENKSEESSPTNMSESCLLKEEESQQPEDVTRAVSEVPEEGFNEDVIKAADICDNKLDGKLMTLLSGDKRMQTAEKQDNFMSTIDDSSSEQDQQTSKGSETAVTGEIVGIKNLEQTTNSISTFPTTEYKNGEQSVEAENSAEPEATEMLVDESKEEAPTGRTDENPTIEKLGSSEGVERPGETVSGTNYPGGAAIKKYETAATQTSLMHAREYMRMDGQKMTTTGVPGDVDGQHAQDEKAPTEHKDTLEVPPITNTGGLNDTDIHSTVCRSEEVKLEGERQKLVASSQIQDYLLTEKENLAGSSAPEDREQVPKSSSAKTSDSLNPGNTYTDQAPEITSSTCTEDVRDSPPDLIVETRKVAELENVGMETEKMKCRSKEEGIDAGKDTKNISMTMVPAEISSSELHEKSVKVKEHPEAETLRLQEEIESIDQQGEKLEAQKVKLAERSSEKASEVKGVADGCNQAPDEETEIISSPKKELKAEECPEEKTKETFEPTKKQSENKQITDSHEMDTLATMDEQNVNINPSDILAMRAIDETAHHEREDYANEEDTKSVASIGTSGTSKIPEEQKGNVLIDNSTANILQENQKFPMTESAQFASSTTDGSIVNEQRVSINNQENISSTETGQERTLGRDTNITAEEQVFSQKATERGIPEDSRNGSKDEKTQISMETPEMESLKSDDSEICSTVLPKIEERIRGSQELLPSSDTKDPCTEVCQKEGTMDTTNVTDAIQDIKPLQAIQVADPAQKEFSAVVQHDPSAKILQKDEGDNFRLEKEPTPEFEDRRKTGGVGEENVNVSESMSSTIILSSDPPKTSIAETSPMARSVIEEVEATVRRDKMQATEVKTVEISNFDEEKEEEEEEEGGEHESEDPGSAALENTEAPMDTNTKASHKKSHNILSSIKHSISKVKKVITGKSSHQKTASPK